MAAEITTVITSCNRHDLLHETLNSFVQVESGGMRPDRCIIVEDSDASMPCWLATNMRLYSACLGEITWLSNGFRQGQVKSIDLAYSLVTSEYIFHLEDDWRFNECRFMEESMELLMWYPKIIQVSLRGDTGWHPLVKTQYFPCKTAMPHWGTDWGGLSWNPGLRRLSDYQRIGGYGRHAANGTHGLVHEALLSRKYLDLGYRIADLGRPIVSHIGVGRSRA